MKLVISRQVVTIPAACLVTALLAGAGCEDTAARQRAETQKLIAEASHELELATLRAWNPGDESAGEQRGRIDAILRKLKSVKAEGGQQAAAALLASTANRGLAQISLAQAEAIETENRDLYAGLHSDIDAALRLRSLADGIEDVSTRGLRAALAAERQAAQERLRTYSQRLAELDGPIAERETENAQDAREASRLEDEAIALRRQASEWGHAAGLATFEQALSLEREADGYEYQIAFRESDLEYDLRPEHALAGARVAFLSERLEGIDDTERALDARDELGAREVRTTRQLIRSYGDQIAEGLETARTRMSGELQEHYTQAQTQLEQAVSQANTAASKSDRGEADAARLTLVRAYENQGRLFATRARGLAAHAEVLERIIGAGGALGDETALRRELDTVRAGEAQALDQARAQFTNAREQLDNVQSKSSQTQVEAFKQGLANALAALGAPATETAPPAREAARRGNTTPSNTPPPTASADGGFATPEALVAALKSAASGDAEAASRMAEAWHTTTPAARRMVAMQGAMTSAQEELMAAMKEQFGDAPEEMLAGMGGQTAMAALGDVQLVDQNERVATVQTGAGQPMSLVKVGGSWKIDGDSMFGSLGAADLEQAEAMMGAMPRAFNDLARRIRGGEFRSADQALQALMGEVMGAMGGAGGAMPGK